MSEHIYVIVEETVVADYGYGGWTGTESTHKEIVGYVTSLEAAQKKVKELRAQEKKDEKKRSTQSDVKYKCFEFEEAFLLDGV